MSSLLVTISSSFRLILFDCTDHIVLNNSPARVTDRIYKFVGSNYGTLASNKFKSAIDDAYDHQGNMTEEGRTRVKEIFIQILQREISKTYKIPNNAFTAFDNTGNNYVMANDIVNSKMAYRLPFNKEELRYFLENETVFKRQPKLTIDMFIKYLFPEKLRGAQQNEDRGASESSGSENDSFDTSTGGSAIRPGGHTRNPESTGGRGTNADTSSFGGTTVSGSLKSQ